MSDTSPSPVGLAAAEDAATPTPVSVIGLGAMGSALAATFLANGHPTTVWNRTSSRVEPLVAAGARAAGSVDEAIAAGSLVVVCLLDHSTVRAVLANADGLSGRVLVDLTSQTPDQARALTAWATGRGAAHLAGGIMADPEQIGTPEATLLLSGDPDAYATHRAALEQLGGGTRHLGADPGLGSLYLTGITALGFELWVGYLHTAALFRAEGVDAASFTPLLADVLGQMVEFLPSLGSAIDDRVYPPDIGPLRVQAALMDDLIDTREARGIDAERLHHVKALMQQRLEDTSGDEGFSSLIELLSPRSSLRPG